MLELPPVAPQAAPLRLPLCDATAAVLVDALLTDDRAQRAALLDAVLRIDPALALWTALQAARQERSLETCAQAAAWLAADLARCLDAPDALYESHDEQSPDAGGTLDRYVLAATRSTALACRAAAATLAQEGRNGSNGSGGCNGSGSAAPAYWLGLICGALGDLAESSGDAIGRLVQPLRSRAAASLAGEPVARGAVIGPVRRAMSQAPERDDDPLPEDAASEVGLAARHHWRQSRPETAALLPRLARRVARLERLECSHQQALHVEKMESLYQLAYGAGHEINNPLANIALRAQTLLADETHPERRRKLAAINRQAFRAHEMIADMMLFARPPVPEPERIDLAKLAAKLIDELTPEADALGTTLMLHAPPPPVWIWADPIQWAVALRAILVNAIEAIGSGGRVEMSVRRVDAGDVRGASDATQASRPRHADPAAPVESPSCASADRGTSAGTSAVAAATSIAQGVLEPRAGASPAGTVEIAIRDNGPGMDERAARHLFDPFFSGREAGRGLGFGLSKAWRIITAHDGEIDVDTRPGFGTTFTIRTGSAGT